MTLVQPLNVPIKETEYELVYNYVYRWEHNGIPQELVIPKGYINDGVSVPQIAWSLTGIRPDGLNRAASLVHDWIYGFGGIIPLDSHQILENGRWKPAAHFWTREEADRMFGRLMREAGTSKFKRRTAYWAVRLFGGSSWGGKL